MGIQQPIGPRASARGLDIPLRPLAAALALAALAGPALADPVTHVVNTCADALVLPVCNGSDDGTLRQALFCAADGDTVDLSQLQCSTITLAAPLIVGTISVDMEGPGTQLTIDAHGQFRAIVHNGRPGDQLAIGGMTIANGRYVDPYSYGNGGGCIYSSGDLQLFGVDVHACYASASKTVATGGAIFAKGTATIVASRVTSSTVAGFASAKYATARGGGVAADTVAVVASTISGNTAAAAGSNTTYGGGIYAKNVTAKYSTIAGNSATSRAGIAAASSLRLGNSTISGNTARDLDGGAKLTAGTAYVANSTIVFNSAGTGGAGGLSAAAVSTNSSIIALNTSAGAASDILAGAGGIAGANNLVIGANTALPDDTIGADPRLGPLQDNGGLSPTHALLADSPALDRGSAAPEVTCDQRFELRVTNGKADIGAFELDRIFAGGFEPVIVAAAGPNQGAPPAAQSGSCIVE